VNDEAECAALSITTIPDPNFEQALIDLGIGTNTTIDGVVIIANISGITSLDVSSNNITDLTGIENFTALTDLVCSSNQLTSLDVSSNTALISLSCFNNQLTSLDVRNGNNAAITSFKATNNPNLSCILVDDASYSATNWTDIDATATFVNNETECASLSIADNTLELGVSVYPNPTDTKLFIEGNENPVSVSIYNVLGKEVISTKNINKIDVKALPSGVYIIKISDGVRQINRKFIKN
jgi:Leucine-rich repeat (LRR) protein